MGEVVAFRIAMLQEKLAFLRQQQIELRRSLKDSPSDEPSVHKRLLSVRQQIAAVKDEVKLLRSLRD